VTAAEGGYSGGTFTADITNCHANDTVEFSDAPSLTSQLNAGAWTLAAIGSPRVLCTFSVTDANGQLASQQVYVGTPL
jgi:hypothetical protein